MADAHGSGPCVGNNMRVQVPSPAYKKTAEQSAVFFGSFSLHNHKNFEAIYQNAKMLLTASFT